MGWNVCEKVICFWILVVPVSRQWNRTRAENIGTSYEFCVFRDWTSLAAIMLPPYLGSLLSPLGPLPHSWWPLFQKHQANSHKPRGSVVMVYVLKIQAQDPRMWLVCGLLLYLPQQRPAVCWKKEEGSPGPSLFWDGTRSAPEMISYSKPVLMLLVKFCPVAKCSVDLDWYGQHSKKESFSTSFRRRSRLYDPEIIPPGIYLREVKTLSIQNLCTNVLKRFFLSQNSRKSKMSNKREEFTNLSIWGNTIQQYKKNELYMSTALSLEGIKLTEQSRLKVSLHLHNIIKIICIKQNGICQRFGLEGMCVNLSC